MNYVIIILLCVYVIVGLVWLHILVTKEIQNTTNNRVIKYYKKLFPISVISQTCVKITNNLANVFSAVLVGAWEIVKNLFDLVVLSFGWPYLIYKSSKVVKEFNQKNS